jgi:AbrB family looped-hinge helix DNA binding protein
MPNVVGERFQITIDKKVRERLGVKPGDLAVEWVENGRLVVGFLPPASNESMLGIVQQLGGVTVEPIDDWDAYFDRVWRIRANEIQEVLDADSRAHGTRRHQRAGG